MTASPAPAPARTTWVDVAKHQANRAGQMGHTEGSDGRLRIFVFAFHVPLFFLISGFFAPRAAAKPFWTAMKRRIRGIVVPFVVWSVVALIALGLNSTTLSIRQLARWAAQQFAGRRIQMPASAMWFLPALFVMQSIYDLLLRALRAVRLPWAEWWLVALGLPLHLVWVLPPSRYWLWSVDSSLYYFFFYALGAATYPALGRWLEQVETSRSRRTTFIAVTIAAAVGAVLAYLAGAKIYDVLHVSGIAYVQESVALVRTLAMCFVVIILAYWLRNVTLFAQLGRETLLFCCTESLLTIALIHVLSIGGLPLRVQTPLAAVLMATLLIAAAHYCLAKPLRERAPILVGG